MKKIIVVLSFALCSVALASGGGIAPAVSFLIDREPGHPKKGDAEWIREIEEAIVSAAQAYHRDPWLLTSMANWESRFRPDILKGKTKGKAGEVGILQCGKDCARKCPHFMDTIEGQAMCGARWLELADNACKGTQKQMLTYYASGQACEIDKYHPKFCELDEDPEGCTTKERSRVRSAVNRRLRLAERLKNRFRREAP